MSNKVESIFRSIAAGAQMESMEDAVINSSGIIGDRYSSGRGRWSAWPDKSGMAITMITREVLDEIGVGAAQVRRNLVTVGVDLESLIGVVFQIGEIECVGIRPCRPCTFLEESVRVGIRSDLKDIRGGLRVDVVSGGRIKVGDEIRLTGFPLYL